MSDKQFILDQLWTGPFNAKYLRLILNERKYFWQQYSVSKFNKLIDSMLKEELITFSNGTFSISEKGKNYYLKGC